MSDEARELWEKICGIVRRFQEDKRFPRKWRVAINIVLCALLAVALYTMLGGPRFSVQGDYRAMERAHLVGPGRILGIETVDFSYYDHLLIAEDEEGVILYAYDSQVWYRSEQMSYRTKTGDVMVLAGPVLTGSLDRHWDFELPVVVFGAPAEAVRARVEIAMPGREDSYVVECLQNNEGYLFGTISYEGHENGQEEVDLLQQLADISSSQSASGDMTVIPIRVWLYDESDMLLAEENIELYSVAYEAAQVRKEERP